MVRFLEFLMTLLFGCLFVNIPAKLQQLAPGEEWHICLQFLITIHNVKVNVNREEYTSAIDNVWRWLKALYFPKATPWHGCCNANHLVCGYE